MSRRRLAAGLVAAALIAPLLAGLSGCTPPPAELPDGVSVSVYQPRTEIESGRIVIQVANDSPARVTVVRAQLESPDYSTPIVWERHDAQLAPGVAIDLRVDPTTPACGEPSDAPLRVTLDFRLDDGREGQALLDATDPFDQFPRIPDELCLGILLDEVADVSTVRLEGDGRPQTPGRLVISVAPTGHGNAMLVAVQSTILVSLLDANGLPTPELAVGLPLSFDTASTELTFPVQPARCDPHAIAEDKEGTLFPISVTVDDRSGTFQLPSTDEFRGQVYAFVQAYCG